MGSLYGYEIESELPLRRLNRAPGTRGDDLDLLGEPPPAAESEGEPVGTLETEDGERCVYASYEIDGGCLLVMPPTGAFLIEPGPGRVTRRREASDDELFEHRLASSAICTLLAMRGDLALHAAAVEGGRAGDRLLRALAARQVDPGAGTRRGRAAR